jgi:hypothetical protein
MLPLKMIKIAGTPSRRFRPDMSMGGGCKEAGVPLCKGAAMTQKVFSCTGSEILTVIVRGLP